MKHWDFYSSVKIQTVFMTEYYEYRLFAARISLTHEQSKTFNACFES